MALFALSIITGGSVYIMNLNKQTKVESAMSRSTTLVELEKKRIATILGDNNTCKLAGNFGGQVPVRASINNLVNSSGNKFVELSGTYFNKLLTVTSISSRLAIASDPNASEIGTDKGYILTIKYSDSTLNNTRNAYTGKKSSIIEIPMYMKLAAGLVSECYSLSQNNNVNMAIRAACSPASPGTTKKSLLNIGTTTESDCEHTINFDPPAGTFTSCNSTATGSVPSKTEALSGWDLVGNKITIPLSKCSGIATNCPTLNTNSYGINASSSLCSYPGGSRDGACGAGQILYHTSGSTTSCVTVNCSNAFEFVQSINSGSTICFKAPATTCPANQYVSVFNNGAPDTCTILPAWSGSCAASNFGSSVTRATATSNGTLNCSPYNKSKVCPAPSTTTFVNQFTATGANCAGTFSPVNGGWSAWSACDAACNQSRACNNPPPSFGGSSCSGASTQACPPAMCGCAHGTITLASSQSWSLPTYCTTATFALSGGGGGGGAGHPIKPSNGGGGGGSAGTIVTGSIGAGIYTITIGAGGAGAPASHFVYSPTPKPGAAGGTSTLKLGATTLASAPGGAGGGAGISASTTGNPGTSTAYGAGGAGGIRINFNGYCGANGNPTAGGGGGGSGYPIWPGGAGGCGGTGGSGGIVITW